MERKPFEDNVPPLKQQFYPCGCPYDLARQSFITEIEKRLKLLKEARLRYSQHMTPVENAANSGAMWHLRALLRWVEQQKEKEEKHRRPKL